MNLSFMSEKGAQKSPERNAARRNSGHDEDSKSEESWQSATHLKKWCPSEWDYPQQHH